MADNHPTSRARTGAAGVLLWVAVVLGAIGVAGFVVTIVSNGNYAG